MVLEIKPAPQIIQHEETTAGKDENSALRYYQILFTGINSIKESSEKKKRGLKLLELLEKMEPDEELAASIEEAVKENRKVKINVPDL